MGLVEVAQSTGDLRAILPSDCEGIDDIHQELVLAIHHAIRIRGVEENLAPDERPPRWMWRFDEPLQAWFEEVERARRDKFGLGGDSAPEGGQVLSNEYAKGRGR